MSDLPSITSSPTPSSFNPEETNHGESESNVLGASKKRKIEVLNPNALNSPQKEAKTSFSLEQTNQEVSFSSTITHAGPRTASPLSPFIKKKQEILDNLEVVISQSAEILAQLEATKADLGASIQKEYVESLEQIKKRVAALSIEDSESLKQVKKTVTDLKSLLIIIRIERINAANAQLVKEEKALSPLAFEKAYCAIEHYLNSISFHQDQEEFKKQKNLGDQLLCQFLSLRAQKKQNGFLTSLYDRAFHWYHELSHCEDSKKELLEKAALTFLQASNFLDAGQKDISSYFIQAGEYYESALHCVERKELEKSVYFQSAGDHIANNLNRFPIPKEKENLLTHWVRVAKLFAQAAENRNSENAKSYHRFAFFNTDILTALEKVPQSDLVTAHNLNKLLDLMKVTEEEFERENKEGRDHQISKLMLCSIKDSLQARNAELKKDLELASHYHHLAACNFYLAVAMAPRLVVYLPEEGKLDFHPDDSPQENLISYWSNAVRKNQKIIAKLEKKSLSS